MAPFGPRRVASSRCASRGSEAARPRRAAAPDEAAWTAHGRLQASAATPSGSAPESTCGRAGARLGWPAGSCSTPSSA
eukprot:14450927-Alexandrium_andersonii.AAC.1